MTLIELRQHILKRLGAPVINVELAPEQMDIYIDDAVDKFIEVHYDGLDEGYIFVTATADTGEYILPDTVHSVLGILGLNASLTTGEPLLINPFLVGNTYANNTLGTAPQVLDLYMFRETISAYEQATEEAISFEFNSTTHSLKFMEIPEVNQTYALRVHASPSNIEDIYNSGWVRKFSTALCKIAWANNIGKFEGATLPGGVALNWQKIAEDGALEKEKLEEEIYERYQEPIDFYFA